MFTEINYKYLSEYAYWLDQWREDYASSLEGRV